MYEALRSFVCKGRSDAGYVPWVHVGHLAHLPDMCLQVHLSIKDNAKITGTGRRSNGGVPNYEVVTLHVVSNSRWTCNDELGFFIVLLEHVSEHPASNVFQASTHFPGNVFVVLTIPKFQVISEL